MLFSYDAGEPSFLYFLKKIWWSPKSLSMDWCPKWSFIREFWLIIKVKFRRKRRSIAFAYRKQFSWSYQWIRFLRNRFDPRKQIIINSSKDENSRESNFSVVQRTHRPASTSSIEPRSHIIFQHPRFFHRWSIRVCKKRKFTR